MINALNISDRSILICALILSILTIWVLIADKYCCGKNE